MSIILLLDLDGVLITTPAWKADELHTDGYSDFNVMAVNNLNKLLEIIHCEIWLSSSRRTSLSLEVFNTVFKNRNIIQQIKGFIPSVTNEQNRLAEINAFLDQEPHKNFIILDDDNSLQNLSEHRKMFWVQTQPLIGFNEEKFLQAKGIARKWL